MAESDLGNRLASAHVLKAGLVLHSAIWGQAGQPRPQRPPGQVQFQDRLCGLSPVGDGDAAYRDRGAIGVWAHHSRQQACAIYSLIC